MKDLYKIIKVLLLIGIVIVIELGEILFLLYGDNFFEHLDDLAKFGGFLVIISKSTNSLIVGWLFNFIISFIMIAVFVSDHIFQWVKSMFEKIISKFLQIDSSGEVVRDTTYGRQLLTIFVLSIVCLFMLGFANR